MFKDVHFLPDPVVGSDDHYISFADIYGKDTNKDHCPSLARRKKTKSLTFSPTEVHACNVGVVIQCDERDKWRYCFRSANCL